jgi:Ca2+-binding EF-hand superfamily protein
MAQALPGGLSQEMTEQLNAAATAHWNDWNENATAEQKAAYRERYRKMHEDQEFASTTMAGLTEAWNGSDADGDGKLNLEEFLAYITTTKAKETEAGCYVRPDPENTRTTALYHIANSIGEGEGLVQMDFFSTMGPWMAKYLEVASSGLSPALKEEIKTVATERYNDFVANATAEQQALHWEFMAKMMNPLESAFRESHTAKMKAAWNAADANQDGLLNQDECRAWVEASNKTRSEEGFYVDADAAVRDRFYALTNQITEGTEGITY